MPLDFRYKLDGSVVGPPKNFNTVSMRLSLKTDINMIVREFPQSVELVDDQYTTLFAYFTNNNFNSKITYTVEYTTDGSTYTTFIDAIIHPSRVEFDTMRKVAVCSLEDASLISSVYVNRNIPVAMDATSSLNGTAISAATQTASFFTATSSNDYRFRSKGPNYRFRNIIDHILNYISDASATMNHDWYTNLNDYNFVKDSNGYPFLEIMYGSYGRTDFRANLQSVLNPVLSLYNTGLCVVTESGTTEIYINDPDDFRSSTVGLTIDSVSDVIIRQIPDYQYTGVSIGDERTEGLSITEENYTVSAATLQPLVTLSAVHDSLDGFKKSTYSSLNRVIPENTLYIDVGAPYSTYFGYRLSDDSFQVYQAKRTDSSPDQYSGIDETLNKPFFVLKEDKSGPFTANTYQGPGVITTGMASWENKEVLARYDFLYDMYSPTTGSLPSGTIELTLASDQTMTEDTKNDFNLLLLETADSGIEFSNEGHMLIHEGVQNGSSRLQIDFDIDITFADSTETANVALYALYDNVYSFLGKMTIVTPTTRNISGTEYIQLRNNQTEISFYIYTYVPDADDIYDLTVEDTSTIDVTLLNTGSVQMVSANPTEVFMYQIDFKAPISIDDFITIYNDPRKAIQITDYDGTVRRGWVTNADYSPEKGLLECKMITNHTNLIIE